MYGADIFIATDDGNDEGQNWGVKDYFSYSTQTPTLDESQDVKLIGAGHYNGDSSYAIFERKAENCDEQDFDVFLKDSGNVATSFIYAFGETSDFYYHLDNRGIVNVILDSHVEDLIKNEILNERLMNHIIEIPTVKVPRKRTSYFCSYHELPKDNTYHLVQVKPIVKSKLVHHMILYRCDSKLENMTTDSFDCEGQMRNGCEIFWTGWAPGVKSIDFPKEAGLKFGLGGEDSTKYVILEIHYDNPKYVEDVEDTSGFNLTFTPDLRENDIGTLILGRSLYDLEIPQGQKSYDLNNVCPASCTNHFPEDGINVIGYQLHMHNYGTSTYTQLIRNQQEIPNLGYQPYYDFNHQKYSYARKGQKILRGDRLFHHCVYDTTSRTNPIIGGEGTDDEMCFNFIQYYPKMKVLACLDRSKNLKDYGVDATLCLSDGRNSLNSISEEDNINGNDNNNNNNDGNLHLTFEKKPYYKLQHKCQNDTFVKEGEKYSEKFNIQYNHAASSLIVNTFFILFSSLFLQLLLL